MPHHGCNRVPDQPTIVTVYLRSLARSEARLIKGGVGVTVPVGYAGIPGHSMNWTRTQYQNRAPLLRQGLALSKSVEPTTKSQKRNKKHPWLCNCDITSIDQRLTCPGILCRRQLILISYPMYVRAARLKFNQLPSWKWVATHCDNDRLFVIADIDRE